MGSPQTLVEADRRIVAGWAADRATRVLGLFEAIAPEDERPRDAIARARAFSRGELDTAGEIAGVSWPAGPHGTWTIQPRWQPRELLHKPPASPTWARTRWELRPTRRKRRGWRAPDRPGALDDEIRWQLEQMSAEVRSALRRLPALGDSSAGPLGPGLLARGVLGTVIRALQAGLAIDEDDVDSIGPPR